MKKSNTVYINLQKVAALVTRPEDIINLCPSGDFELWTNIAYDIACTGDDGLEIFKTISSTDDSYNEQDCETRYSYELRKFREKGFKQQPVKKVNANFLHTLMAELEKHGVKVADIISIGSDLDLKAIPLKPAQKVDRSDPDQWTIPMKLWEYYRKPEDMDWQRNSLLASFGILSDTYIHSTAIDDEMNSLKDRYQLGFRHLNDCVTRDLNRHQIGYPYIDDQGRLRAAKFMKYDNRGHRMRNDGDVPVNGQVVHYGSWKDFIEANPMIKSLKNKEWQAKFKLYYFGDPRDIAPVWFQREAWVKRELDKQSKGAWKQWLCFFGLHLVPSSSQTVAIVESEKTALIMSLVMTSRTWIACGGKSNLSFMLEDARSVLEGHHVEVYPDKDAVQEWQAAFIKHASGLDCKFVEWWNGLQVEPKWDIADAVMSDAEHMKTSSR